jgi:hypothetical protein
MPRYRADSGTTSSPPASPLMSAYTLVGVQFLAPKLISGHICVKEDVAPVKLRKNRTVRRSSVTNARLTSLSVDDQLP